MRAAEEIEQRVAAGITKATFNSRIFVATVAALFFLSISTSPRAETNPDQVDATDVYYRAYIPGSLSNAKSSLVSALEGRNFAIINTLNVQQGLKNRGIVADPMQLVEFINLREAYKITKSNRLFEVFAPLRAALFQEKGRVEVLVLRPLYIERVLARSGLSSDGQKVLENFDNEIADILHEVAAGGF